MNRVVAGLSAAVALPVAALAYLYRRPLPRTKGNLRLPGLKATVEVVRDRWGVPHIYASGLEDLFFAQGFVHTQDRLWQMELNRRTCHGRLSEIFGEIALDTDVWMRTIGLTRVARKSLENLDATERGAIEDYTRGVNAGIDASRGHLPLEFTLLRITPEPWHPIDSVVWGSMMAWSLTASWGPDLFRAALISRLGAERAAGLRAGYPAGNPLVLPDQTRAAFAGAEVEEYRLAARWLPFGPAGGMSNNWVVDGTKSTTDKPLLANDPHLGQQLPSIWYESHLVCPELEVAGVSLPGVPAIVIGHNQEIAWGLTNGQVDVQDVYLEKLHPEDPTQYEYQGGWEQAEVVREEIRIKGRSEPRVVEVAVTRHGPIVDAISPVKLKQPGYALALRWAGYEPNTLLRACLLINRARNWDEFQAALRGWDVPSQNFVFADRAGNVGYCLAGRIPIRAKGSGAVPVPGWTGEYEWTGWIPFEEFPRALNPAQHYLATANNLVAGDGYPHLQGGEWCSGYRARRIVDLLTSKERLSAEDFARIQVDLSSLPAETLCALLDELGPSILAQPSLSDHRVGALARRSLAELHAWDRRLMPDSVPAAIFELLQHFAMRRVFEPWLGDLTDGYIGLGHHPVLEPLLGAFFDSTPTVLHRILLRDEREWYRDSNGAPLDRAGLLALALADAIAYLRQTLGEDVGRWRWGSLHRIAFAHALGAVKPLDRIFSRGPYPSGGDATTVWQGAFVPTLPIRPDAGFVPSWRQIVDLGDWDASLGVHAPGQSGHPASRHYDDLIPLWRRGEYHPLAWSRKEVERHAEARLRLEPQDKGS